jgi:acyl-coenzyme A thioesterase PaaI-like protein
MEVLDVPAGFARHDRKSPLTEPIAALADNAMGLSCGRRLGGAAGGLVTVNLTVDFLGSALKGQWLEFDTVFVKPGSTLCFTQAFVTADGQPCARANAVFRVLTRRAAA